MNLAPELLAAYRRTLYCVYVGDYELHVRIDEPSAELDRVLADSGVTVAALITASNPRSERLTNAENTARNAQLLNAVTAAGFKCLHGEGRDPDKQWPAEQSLLILGIAQPAATGLAQNYAQNAWVLIEQGRPPTLITCV